MYSNQHAEQRTIAICVGNGIESFAYSVEYGTVYSVQKQFVTVLFYLEFTTRHLPPPGCGASAWLSRTLGEDGAPASTVRTPRPSCGCASDN